MPRLILLGLAGLLLAACATPRQPVDEQSEQRWQQRVQQLAALDDWQLRGRVAVFVDDEVYNLGLRWLRQGSASSLSFEASLGQGLIELEKTEAGVELNTSEGQSFSGSNAQAVIQQATGLVVPVRGLESWIKGVPHPRRPPEYAIDSQGRATHIVQDAWFINYLDYTEVDLPGLGATELPRRLYMKHDDIALKLVIDQWLSEEAAPADPGLFPDFPGR